ncbi:hypothetical protein ACJX0J_015240, partial [Zea mays]
PDATRAAIDVCASAWYGLQNRVYYQRSLVREIEARLKAKCDTLADLFAMDERYGLKVRMELLMAKALCGGICGRKVCDGGSSDLVYEYVLVEEKYTFVGNVKNPCSCTILIK